MIKLAILLAATALTAVTLAAFFRSMAMRDDASLSSILSGRSSVTLQAASQSGRVVVFVTVTTGPAGWTIRAAGNPAVPEPAVNAPGTLSHWTSSPVPTAARGLGANPLRALFRAGADSRLSAHRNQAGDLVETRLYAAGVPYFLVAVGACAVMMVSLWNLLNRMKGKGVGFPAIATGRGRATSAG